MEMSTISYMCAESKFPKVAGTSHLFEKRVFLVFVQTNLSM